MAAETSAFVDLHDARVVLRTLEGQIRTIYASDPAVELKAVNRRIDALRKEIASHGASPAA